MKHKTLGARLRDARAAAGLSVRELVPSHPLTYGQSLGFGRVQAAHVREWAKAHTPDINLVWLLQQRAVPVNRVASYLLKEESGLTTDLISGRLEMYINENEPLV